MNRFNGWVNLFWIQFKRYFSSVTSWLTLIFVPIVFSIGLGATIGVATGFVPALCMILIVLQANVFSNCYFSFKKSTLNSNLDLTTFTKMAEYTTTICLIFFVSLIGVSFALSIFILDTQLLPMMGIDPFLPIAPALAPNPIITAPRVVLMNLRDFPKDAINAAKIRAPHIGYTFGPNEMFKVVDAGYLTNWLYFEWNVLLYFLFMVTMETVLISLLFTTCIKEVKTYFLFMFVYLVVFLVFGGISGPRFNYATPNGSFSSFQVNGKPHTWYFYVERLNPLYYINQWAFTVLSAASVYEFDIAYTNSAGEEVIVSFYQSTTPLLRMSYDPTTKAYLQLPEHPHFPNPKYYLVMTSPRMELVNAIPETKRWVFGDNSVLYNMLLYMPWVWAGFYLTCIYLIEYIKVKKR